MHLLKKMPTLLHYKRNSINIITSSILYNDSCAVANSARLLMCHKKIFFNSFTENQENNTNNFF